MSQSPHPSIRPRRSALFVPADNLRALQKITPSLAADCVIIDLEDAVSSDNKGSARQRLPDLVGQMRTGGRELLLRINSCGSDAYSKDLALAYSLPIDAVVLPKVEYAEQLQQLAQALPESVQIWAMIESARGVLNISSICDAHPKLSALMLGTQDLGLDLQLPPGNQSQELIDHCLMQCVLSARAAGIAAIDAVCPEFKDLSQMKEQCHRAVNRGFDGKAAIHPAQLNTINTLFSPSASQLAQAKEIVRAWNEAESQGLSVANLDGRMIEQLHMTQANLLLEKARVIAAIHQVKA